MFNKPWSLQNMIYNRSTSSFMLQMTVWILYLHQNAQLNWRNLNTSTIFFRGMMVINQSKMKSNRLYHLNFLKVKVRVYRYKIQFLVDGQVSARMSCVNSVGFSQFKFKKVMMLHKSTLSIMVHIHQTASRWKMRHNYQSLTKLRLNLSMITSHGKMATCPQISLI